MPKTIIVTSELKDSQTILSKLVEKKIVQMTSCKGIFIFARHYLRKSQLRNAYKRIKNDNL